MARDVRGRWTTGVGASRQGVGAAVNFYVCLKVAICVKKSGWPQMLVRGHIFAKVFPQRVVTSTIGMEDEHAGKVLLKHGRMDVVVHGSVLAFCKETGSDASFGRWVLSQGRRGPGVI